MGGEELLQGVEGCSWGDLTSSRGEENLYCTYGKEQWKETPWENRALHPDGGWGKEEQGHKDTTHHQSHFLLGWGAVDAVAVPTGRPEAEESGSTVHYRAHRFTPVRGQHCWDTLTSFPVLRDFLLLKACRMLNYFQWRQGVLLDSQVPSFLCWLQEAPTQTRIPWVAAVLGQAQAGVCVCGCLLGKEHLGVMQPPPTGPSVMLLSPTDGRSLSLLLMLWGKMEKTLCPPIH